MRSEGSLKTDFAYFVEASLGLFCTLTGHFHCCWILNKGPLYRLWVWSVKTSAMHWNNPNTSGSGTVNYYSFDFNDK